MDITKLKRDAKRIFSDLTELSSGETITQKGCKIVFPYRYIETGLGTLGNLCYLFGIYAIIVDDKFYGVSKAICNIETNPDEINDIEIDKVPYVEFVYYPKSTVINKKVVLENVNLLYLTWNELISKGNLPWFFNYKDLGDVFKNTQHFTGTKLGSNIAILELVASVISKDPNNLRNVYRYVIKEMSDIINNPPVIVKLNSVSLNATNTLAKMTGGYWNEGIPSALVNPSDTKEPIEALLTK